MPTIIARICVESQYRELLRMSNPQVTMNGVAANFDPAMWRTKLDGEESVIICLSGAAAFADSPMRELVAQKYKHGGFFDVRAELSNIGSLRGRFHVHSFDGENIALLSDAGVALDYKGEQPSGR